MIIVILRYRSFSIHLLTIFIPLPYFITRNRWLSWDWKSLVLGLNRTETFWNVCVSCRWKTLKFETKDHDYLYQICLGNEQFYREKTIRLLNNAPRVSLISVCITVVGLLQSTFVVSGYKESKPYRLDLWYNQNDSI